jgi:anthranilate synthase component II
MKILLLDNYDSFTYNLYHLLHDCGESEIIVRRNNEITLDEVNVFDKILLSPGPGLPNGAGLMPEIIKQFAKEKNILGVCLGLQAITESFGGSLLNLKNVFHGVATNIYVKNGGDKLFLNVPGVFPAGRYHSWVADSATLPSCLEITAIDNENQIMAIKHRELNIYGVQFHPESVLTPCGKTIIQNWLRL